MVNEQWLRIVFNAIKCQQSVITALLCIITWGSYIRTMKYNHPNNSLFDNMLLCKPYLPCPMNSHITLINVLTLVKAYNHSTNQDIFLTNLVFLRQAKMGFGWYIWIFPRKKMLAEYGGAYLLFQHWVGRGRWIYKFKTSLVYVVRPCLKNKAKQKHTHTYTVII